MQKILSRSGLVSAIFLTLGVVLVVTLPVAIKHYAEQWLAEQGADEVEFQNVDLNLFTGVLQLQGVHFSRDQAQVRVDQLRLNVEWTALFSWQFLVSEFLLEGGHIDVHARAGQVLIGGLNLFAVDAVDDDTAEGQPGGDPLDLGVANVSLQNVRINYSDEQFTRAVDIKLLTLDRATTWAPDQPTLLNMEVALDGALAGMILTTHPFAAEPRAEAQITIEALELNSYAKQFAGLDLASSLHTQLTVKLLQQANGDLDINASGDVSLKQSVFTLPANPGLQFRNDDLLLETSLTLKIPTGSGLAPELEGVADVRITGLSIGQSVDASADGSLQLLNIGSIELGQVVISGLNQLTINRTTVGPLKLIQQTSDEHAAVSLEQLLVEQLSLTNLADLSVQGVKLTDLVVHLVRDRDGKLPQLETTMAALGEPGESARDDGTTDGVIEAEQEAAVPFRFLLHELVIEGNSTLYFEDAAADPRFAMKVKLDALRATNLGNVAPEQAMHVVMQVSQGDAATVSVEGDAWLFREALGADVQLGLKNFDLSQVSSYIPTYDIKSGRMALKSHVVLEGVALKIGNEVNIEKLKLIGQGDDAWVVEGMGMPVDVALDMLRDSDERIKLSLPVSGNLDDLKLDTGDIVKVAMQKALQKAAMSYVKNALQPLGTILLFANVAGKVARPRFEPLDFVPGEVALDKNTRAYADKIGQLLKDRPRLSITFCGVATGQDEASLRAALEEKGATSSVTQPTTQSGTPPSTQPGTQPAPETTREDSVAVAATMDFQPQLMALAQARQSNLFEFLVSQHNIHVDRLFTCKPGVEASADKKPRVEVML